MAPLLIRNMVTSLFIYADKSLLNLSEKYKLLELIRYVAISSFLFFLRILPSLFPSLNPEPEDYDSIKFKPLQPQTDSHVACACGVGVGDSGIARALSQLLSIVNDIPVSSRKYEIVRSLAERLIEENHREDVQALREVNRTVLSAAFSRTLRQLEAAMAELGQDGSGPGELDQYRLGKVLRAVRSVGGGAWTRAGKRREDMKPSGNSAEKLAAELLWLAQKLGGCGFEEEAVERWASASNVARLSLSAEPRLQCSLLKVSAFLFKQAKDIGAEEEESDEDDKKLARQRQTKVKMLMSWLPLLCKASNGTDVPALSVNERAEVEKVLEESIEMLEQEEQEQVLSLWLHHFTYSPSSDWPNLHASYARWCSTSRNLLLLH
ncbi:hypothetical protein COLO4_07841 [Corchorus olitorius]|uniref:Uncharacterized protein n=1 Tax=Corchorus olitorius TaxID=93759 RepID=A0A1R3KIN2_9ROSI|nr:hypothetical protein COLO4_07841 [Corchorus olitorius]